MKKGYMKVMILCMAVLLVTSTTSLFAGNKDRSGQAGAPLLLINPWAKGSGWSNVNTSCVTGVEAMYSNVAGMAFTNKTEIILANTFYLVGTGTNLISAGISQKVGQSNSFGLSFQSMNFGKIERTTTDMPEGGAGTYSPSYILITASYARAFSNSIYGGISLKIINESAQDQSATGVVVDAGIQYVTGKNDNFKFGITLKNIGTKMKYQGDGLAQFVTYPTRPDDKQFTLQQRAVAIDLPTQLIMGISYKFIFNPNLDLTIAGNFVSNAYGSDNFGAGFELGVYNIFQLRAGYAYEDGMHKPLDTGRYGEKISTRMGFSCGATIQAPLSKTDKNKTLGIDYSYTPSDPFQGSHTIGLRFSL